MMRVPRRHAHFVYGVIQSGLTCAVAAGIASYPFLAEGTFLVHWARSWVVAWLTILPIVLIAAPSIRKLVDGLTSDDP